MAGISPREIKNRIRSMESTRQITRAMEMVAASKLSKAQAQLRNSRPYFEILTTTVREIVDADRELSSPYLKERTGGKSLYIVIAGDRGLAGGYNHNILKLVQSEIQGKDAVILPIGKKAGDYFRSHKVPILDEAGTQTAEMDLSGCFALSRRLCEEFLRGEFDEIWVVYTRFVSVLSQVPTANKLLPMVRSEENGKASSRGDTLFEPDAQEVFSAIVPEYLGGVLYGFLCESRASEQAARRAAMDSATQNADDMITDLSRRFSRARQAAITREITEIVAGS